MRTVHSEMSKGERGGVAGNDLGGHTALAASEV